MESPYKKTGKLFSIYLMGNVLQNVLSVLLIPLYTRILSPKDFGILALMSFTVSLITRIIVSPIIKAFERFYHHPEYKSQNGLLLFNLFWFLTIKAMLVSFFYWIASPFLCRFLLSEQTLIPVVQIYTFILFLTSMSVFLTIFLRLREMARFYVMLSLVKLAISTSVILYGLLWLKIGIYAPILGLITGLICFIGLSLPVFVRNATFTLSFSTMKEPLKYGYPLILSGCANMLIQSGDRYVLRIFDSLNMVGVYSFGYTISSIIAILIVEPLKQSLHPIVFKLEENSRKQKRFLIATATYYYLISIFMTLGLSLFAREAIMFMAYKPEFWSAWVIVPLISFSYVQHGLGNVVEWGLVMKNKSHYIASHLLLSAGINIGLNFLFIPFWGILGAAFATLISYLVWNGLKIYYSAKFYELHFDLVRLAHISGVGVGLYLASLVLAVTPNTFVNIGIKTGILLSYPFIFLLTGFFSQQEQDFMQKLWKSLRMSGLRATYAKIKAI